MLASFPQAVSAPDYAGQKVDNEVWFIHVYDVHAAVGNWRQRKLPIPIVRWSRSEWHDDGHGVTVDVTLTIHQGENQVRRDWRDEFEEDERRI